MPGELRVCPICGESVAAKMGWIGAERIWTVLCERAGHHFVEAQGKTRKQAEAAWNERVNTRAPGSAMDEELPQPVAWRYRYLHPNRENRWIVRQSPIAPSDCSPGFVGIEVEPLFALAHPASAAEGSQGWVEWRGGKCPVEDDALVQVRYREDDESGLISRPAGRHSWLHSRFARASDILAYRIAPPALSADGAI